MRVCVCLSLKFTNRILLKISTRKKSKQITACHSFCCCCCCHVLNSQDLCARIAFLKQLMCALKLIPFADMDLLENFYFGKKNIKKQRKKNLVISGTMVSACDECLNHYSDIFIIDFHMHTHTHIAEEKRFLIFSSFVSLIEIRQAKGIAG